MNQKKLSFFTLILAAVIGIASTLILQTEELAKSLLPVGLFVYAAFLSAITMLWRHFAYIEIRWHAIVSLGVSSGAFTAVAAYITTKSAPITLAFLATYTMYIYTFVIGSTLINIAKTTKNYEGYSERIALCFPVVCLLTPTGFFINAGIGLIIGALGIICLWSLRDKASHVMRQIVLQKNDHPVEDEIMRWHGSTIVSVVCSIASLLLFTSIGASERELVSNDYVIGIFIAIGMIWTVVTNLLTINKLLDANKHMFVVKD